LNIKNKYLIIFEIDYLHEQNNSRKIEIYYLSREKYSKGSENLWKNLGDIMEHEELK